LGAVVQPGAASAAAASASAQSARCAGRDKTMVVPPYADDATEAAGIGGGGGGVRSERQHAGRASAGVQTSGGCRSYVATRPGCKNSACCTFFFPFGGAANLPDPCRVAFSYATLALLCRHIAPLKRHAHQFAQGAARRSVARAVPRSRRHAGDADASVMWSAQRGKTPARGGVRRGGRARCCSGARRVLTTWVVAERTRVVAELPDGLLS
jgi:hypothetical protein